ncbi:MAG: nitrate reductase molybdenum cofactor assembly chaperone [Rhodospirillales bacterium]|nr:nitrate reductase molybdenum cofactor assembly chaperone [Rhodospirillales bacterium]
MRTLKILSALLSYPTAELLAGSHELLLLLDREAALPRERRRALARLADRLGAMTLLDAQEAYVGLFDRNRSLSLHLFEHVHGESRERGQAMVRLAALYRLHGMEIAARELPDYLPLYLEFLSTLDPDVARRMLTEAAPVIAALGDKLRARASDYAAIMDAAAALAATGPTPEAIAASAARLAPEADGLDALDRAWEEEAVRFAAAPSPEACGETVP